MPNGRTRELVEDLVAAELPRVLWIELTSKCPFDCVFCSRRLRRGAGEHLDYELYTRLVSELDRPEILRLNYSGESVHYPRLPEAIRLAAATGAETELVTALGSAPDALLPALVESGLDRLTVSLHAMSAEGYRSVYRYGSLEAVEARVKRLRALQRAAGSRKPAIDFAFVAMRRNLQELERVAGFAREVGARDVFVHPVLRRDPIDDPFDEELDGGRLRDAFRRELAAAVREARRRFDDVGIHVSSAALDEARCLGEIPVPWPARLPDGARIRTCDQNPWETAHVLANGDVVLCEVRDRVPLGNLRHASLREIWRGEAYRDARRRYVRGGLAECRDCAWKVAYRPSRIGERIAAAEGPSAQLVRGWYPIDGHRSLWSRRDAVLVLARAGGATRLRVEGMLPPAMDAIPNHLRVEVDGRPAALVLNPGRAPLAFQTCVGLPERAGGVATVRLETRVAFRPSAAGINGDARDLGFALFAAELLP